MRDTAKIEKLEKSFSTLPSLASGLVERIETTTFLVEQFLLQ